MMQRIWKWRIPVILCGLGMFLELFVFNFRHWESMLWRDEHLLMQDWAAERGLELVENPVFRVTEKEGEETATIEFENIGQKLHNIHVSLEILHPVTLENKAVNIQLKMTDAANEKYFRLPERDILSTIPKSEYIRLHTSGETESVLLIINAQEGDLIRVNDVSANVVVPMFISLVRIAVTILLLFAIYYLRASSTIHKKLFLEMTWKGKLFIAAILCTEFLSAGLVCQSNPDVIKGNQEMQHTQQYQMLAHSLAEGRTWLDVEPDKVLTSLSNPYDYRLRSMVMENENGTYLWDTAYFEGRYYVYFGIVPELLFFLPYFLITGKDLAVIPVVWLEGCLFLAGIFALLGAFIRKWYPKTQMSLYFLLALVVANGSGVWTYFRNPTFYEVPILAALALGAWGLYFWLSALEHGHLSKIKLTTGSLFLALIAGCRPQLVLLLFLAVPIFWEYAWDSIRQKEKRLPELLCFGLPILLVAVGLMYYNYIRFGSVTDFGANYNLTLQDMTRRKIDLGRTAFGFFTMFFQPPYMTGVFPYFRQVDIVSQYYGQTIQESGFGGVIATNLMLLISLIPFRFKKILENPMTCVIACMLTGFAVVIAFFDIQIGGMIPRYAVDVTWLLFLVTALIIMAGAKKMQGTFYWKPCYQIFVLFCIQSLSFNYLTVYTDVYTKVKDVNPEWFYQAEYLIEFWH